MSSDRNVLRMIKLFHTVVWAFFAGLIVAIPVTAWLGWYRDALLCSAIVLVEVMVLVFNGFRCPLSAVAARHTDDDRRANFDIYLPEWLASHNKGIFGALYVAGMLIAVWSWSTRPR